MEMLLVQGVIVSLVAMGWPSLRTSLDKNRLLESAKQVRVELARTRLEAIETGQTLQFRYRLDDDQYEISPVQLSSTRMRTTLVSDRASEASSFDENAPGDDATFNTLPDGITFLDPDSLDESFENVDRDQTEEYSKVDDDTESEGWSSPVVFYPNGKASNAQLLLGGDREYHVQVAVRGLTGKVTVGDLQRDEDDDK